MAVTSTAMTMIAKFSVKRSHAEWPSADTSTFWRAASTVRSYTGVTSNLGARVYQHKQGTASAFTRRYKVRRLVYFEEFELVTDAIRRENTIKGWPRAWKIRTIEAVNPDWKDLTEEMWMD